MKVTNVRVMPLKNGTGATKGYASITLDEAFAVNDIRVMEGKNGLFIAMPNRKGKDKDGNEKYFDIAFPTTAELRKNISDAIINKFNETVSGQTAAQSQQAPVSDAPADEADPQSSPAPAPAPRPLRHVPASPPAC